MGLRTELKQRLSGRPEGDRGQRGTTCWAFRRGTSPSNAAFDVESWLQCAIAWLEERSTSKWNERDLRVCDFRLRALACASAEWAGNHCETGELVEYNV